MIGRTPRESLDPVGMRASEKQQVELRMVMLDQRDDMLDKRRETVRLAERVLDLERTVMTKYTATDAEGSEQT